MMLGQLTPSKKDEKQQPLARLRGELGSLVDRFFGRGRRPARTGDNWDLLGVGFGELEVEDRDAEIVVRAELPGFEPEEVTAEISGQLLTIQAEKEQQANDGGGAQRAYRYFYESLLLPEGIRPDDIQARLHSGVLEVHVPKTEAAHSRRIAVQA
jgi:HSP20 family protein